MALTVNQMIDLTMSTLENLDAPSFEEQGQTLTDYPGYNMLIGDGSKVTKGTGDQITRRMRFDGASNARFTGLHAKDAPATEDGLARAVWDWCHYDNNYAYEYREPLFQAADADGFVVKLADILTERRNAAYVDQAELIERAFWSKPSTDDGVTPWGVECYVVVPTSAITAADMTQTGGRPLINSVATTVGLNSDTYTKYKNWQGTYDNFTDSDLYQKMRYATLKTGFKLPSKVSSGGGTEQGESRYQIYMGTDALVQFENSLKLQNEDIGTDVIPYAGQSRFFRSRVNHVPYLDTFTDKRILMLDWRSWEFCALKGDHFRTSDVRPHPFSHNTMVVYIDGTYQIICKDRRRQAALAQV
jgi:hypothetical protein